MDKLPISAVVVTCNESHILEPCLQSLAFCEEIIGVDLGSIDSSKVLLEKYTRQVYDFNRTPVVEEVKNFALSFASFDWILFIDPDERIDVSLPEYLCAIIQQDDRKTAIVNVPWLFYYKRKALKGTFWGQHNQGKDILIHKQRASVNLYVHGGYKEKQGFTKKYVRRNGTNVLHHYWMSSFAQLLAKHKMYILKEGEAKYKQGVRYSSKKQLKNILTEFYDSFIIFKGYRDGFTGLWLSMFRSWYIYQSWKSLKKFQSRLPGRGN